MSSLGTQQTVHTPSLSKEIYISLIVLPLKNSHHYSLKWSPVSSSGLPSTRKTGMYCSKTSEEQVGWSRLEPLEWVEDLGAEFVQPGDGAFTAAAS